MMKKTEWRTLKVLKTLLLVIAPVCVLFQDVVISMAYDYDTYELTPEGDWIVDEFHGESVQVTLLQYMKPNDIGLQTSKGYYSFSCHEGDFPDDWDMPVNSIIYFFQAIQHTVYDTLPNGDEVWIWNFSIQPGTYSFAAGWNNGRAPVFKQDFTLPFGGDMNTEPEEELMTVEDGDKVVLYSMYGEGDWKEEVMDDFIEWAKKDADARAHAFDSIDLFASDEPTEDKKEEKEGAKEEGKEGASSSSSLAPSFPSLEPSVSPSLEASAEKNTVSSEEIRQDEDRAEDLEESSILIKGLKILPGALILVALGILGYKAVKKK